VADPSDEAREAALEVAPGAVGVADVEELLACDLDGVVIATPSALHADGALPALQRGVAVFCQKPLGRDAPEAARIVDAAEEADRLLGVDLSYRGADAARRVRELVRRGDLGDVFAADLVFHNAYGPANAWAHDRQLSGGGCVLDLGIHVVDLALWTLDFPEVEAVSGALHSRGRRLRQPTAEIEDHAEFRIELATGATVRVACSWDLPAGQDAVIGAAFYGTQGGAALRNVGGSFYDFVAERFRGREREVISAPPDAWGGRVAVDWVAALSDGARFDPAVRRTVDVARVLDAVYGGGLA